MQKRSVRQHQHIILCASSTVYQHICAALKLPAAADSYSPAHA
jgi:hypothetical protein